MSFPGARRSPAPILTAVAAILSSAFLGVAAASHVACGEMITEDTTLDSDIGPCVGNGIVVAANNITLDLGGHTVIGNNTANQTPNEQVGILLRRVSGVTVRNGEVRNFDAGVAVMGGARNTVTTVHAHDNINHLTLTGALNACDFGDGITIFDSDDNRISRNRATHNGPYSGISLVGDSDRNNVLSNHIADQTVFNVLPNGQTGPCGPQEPDRPDLPPEGRRDQDIGIRIEGPGANNNTLRSNELVNNMTAAVSIHGHLCQPLPPTPPTPHNNNNLVQSNRVSATWRDGIHILSQGGCASWYNTIIRNTVTGSGRHGITANGFTGSASRFNTINYNSVSNTGRNGFHVDARDNTLVGNRATGSGGRDGFDSNPDCDNNRWSRNRFGTVNQACVRAGGGTGTVLP